MTNINGTLDEAAKTKLLEEFHRDGVAKIPGVLTREECTILRAKTDEMFANPEIMEICKHGTPFVLSNPLLYDRVFADLFLREPILNMVQAILGKECRYCGQSIIRNHPGEAITFWHVDDCGRLDFPLPDSVPRHDVRIRMPVFWLSVQIALTDIDTVDDGPTEMVLGSHYSGRLPNSQEKPVFEGREPVPIFCKAGDCYLFNHQTWHRGGPNRSQRTRYLLQLQYAEGGTRDYRFLGLLDNPRLETILKGADDELLRVLGRVTPVYGT